MPTKAMVRAAARVLPELHERFAAAGGTIQFNSEANPDDIDGHRDRLPRIGRARHATWLARRQGRKSS